MARPTYPGAALASIFDKSTQSSPARLSIVEAGSGTGIFTRSMIQHLNLKNTLADILCVEPAAGMRLGFQNSSTAKELRSNLTLRVIDGTFDSIDVQDQSVDLVVIAQAFHWIGKDGSAAVQEIARILKPGGKFCCIWNLEDKETAWVAQVRDLYEQYEGGTPQYRLGYWKSIFDTAIYKSSFHPVKLEHYRQNLLGSTEIVVERIKSKSYMTTLEEEEQEDLIADVMEVMKRGEGRVWIDESNDKFEYPYVTDLYMMERK